MPAPSKRGLRASTGAEGQRDDDRRPAKSSSPRDAETAVEIVGMNKWYGEFHVLRDINLKVMRGERIVICGPSGSRQVHA